VLALAVVFWLVGFDIIYATLDELFDREYNLCSFVSRYGRKTALRISGVLHVLSFLTLVLLFIVYIRGIAALPFLVLTGILLYFEHSKAEDVELAFFKINAALGFVVLGMVMMGVYFP